MEKLEINHEAEDLHEALGISTEMHRKIKDCAIRQTVEHDAISSKVIEEVLREINPQSILEAAYVGFVIKGIMDRMEHDIMFAAAAVFKHHNPTE